MLGAGVVVVLAGVAYANFRFKRVDGVAVNTEAIQKRDLKAIVSASGKIQPKRFVNISADTSGRVTELAVEEGDRVKQGQFLLQIDPRNLRTRVQSGEASVGAARSQLEQMRLSLDSARTALKQAEDAYRRQQNLAKGGLTTKETLERAENDLNMRKADLASQEQNLRTLQLRTEQEQATLENAKTDLSKVRIESPIDGIITRRNVEQGETAVVGTMNNAGTVLLQVADMSIIEAEVEVDETDIPAVQLGQSATITVDAINGKTFTAKVTEIGNSPIQTTARRRRRRRTSRSHCRLRARSRTCDPASPAPPKSRRRRAAPPWPCRFRRRPSARW
jgi:HlyD family secretion protein